jgi:hypothetical protein
MESDFPIQNCPSAARFKGGQVQQHHQRITPCKDRKNGNNVSMAFVSHVVLQIVEQCMQQTDDILTSPPYTIHFSYDFLNYSLIGKMYLSLMCKA